MGEIKCIELTKDNYKKYLNQVVTLEEMVSKRMIEEGRIGQFFETGKDGIEEYILSKYCSVMIANDDSGEVQSAAYLTRGQVPFTYNDITKYFKYGESYREYVKSLYSSDIEYKMDILKIYEIKLKAYEYAKKKVLEECPKYNGSIMDYLDHELQEKENGFHEKSRLREGLNHYMSEYIAKQGEKIKGLYEMFYWISADDISKIFQKSVILNSDNSKEYESLIALEKSQELISTKKSTEYSKIISKVGLGVLEEPRFKGSKYFKANTENSIEIDTYITNPNFRQAGLARIIVFEGLKKYITEYFEDTKNSEIYLCSTLHRDNTSSKYVSEFFGLKDNIYVERRNGRNREVHICKIRREEYKEYLKNIEEKIIVLYGYNPEKKYVPDGRSLEIIKEQIKYEEEQVKQLTVKSGGKYKGNFNSLARKTNKIEDLKLKAREIRSRMQRKIDEMMCSR